MDAAPFYGSVTGTGEIPHECPIALGLMTLLTPTLSRRSSHSVMIWIVILSPTVMTAISIFLSLEFYQHPTGRLGPFMSESADASLSLAQIVLEAVNVERGPLSFSILRLLIGLLLEVIDGRGPHDPKGHGTGYIYSIWVVVEKSDSIYDRGSRSSGWNHRK